MNREFEKHIEELLKSGGGPTEPGSFEMGGFIHTHLEDVPHYADRTDGRCVLRALDDDRIIGTVTHT